MIYVSKAFDSVNHAILLEKNTTVCSSRQRFECIASFLTDSTQSTKVNGDCSLPTSIMHSIVLVQGSVTGPYPFIAYVCVSHSLVTVKLQ